MVVLGRRTIYNMCTQKPPHDYSEQLYTRYRDSFNKYIDARVRSGSVPFVARAAPIHVREGNVAGFQNLKSESAASPQAPLLNGLARSGSFGPRNAQWRVLAQGAVQKVEQP